MYCAQQQGERGNEIAADSREGPQGAGLSVYEFISSDGDGAIAGVLRVAERGCGLGHRQGNQGGLRKGSGRQPEQADREAAQDVVHTATGQAGIYTEAGEHEAKAAGDTGTGRQAGAGGACTDTGSYL